VLNYSNLFWGPHFPDTSVINNNVLRELFLVYGAFVGQQVQDAQLSQRDRAACSAVSLRCHLYSDVIYTELTAVNNDIKTNEF